MKHLIALFAKLDSSKLNSVNETKESMVSELTQTIEQFSKTVYNPKLINTLLDVQSNTLDVNTQRLIEELDITGEDQMKNELSLINNVQKLESQLRKLQDHNNVLIKKLEKKESDELTEKSMSNEEIIKLRRKLNDEKLQKEELESSLNYIKQLNKDLESKMSMIEDENKTLKKSFKSANEKLIGQELTKNKNVNLENELRYKESIISYLESLLKNTKISPNMYDESKYHEHFENNKRTVNFHNKNITLDPNYKYENDESGYDFGHSVDQRISFNPEERKAKKFELPVSHDTSLIKDMDNDIKQLNNYENSEYRIKPSGKNSPREFNSSKTSALKYEIDSLDGEIKQLQNKLRVMIDINKK
jgi:hypothetical protein